MSGPCHIDICLNALAIAQLVSEPKPESKRVKNRKQKSPVLELFEMTKSTAAGRLSASSHHCRENMQHHK